MLNKDYKKDVNKVEEDIMKDPLNASSNGDVSEKVSKFSETQTQDTEDKDIDNAGMTELVDTSCTLMKRALIIKISL